MMSPAPETDSRFRIGLTLALLVAGVGLFTWRQLAPGPSEGGPAAANGAQAHEGTGQEARPSWTHQGEVYGSTFEIKVVLPVGVSAPSPAELLGEVGAALARVDVAMSTYRPDSEISRINAGPAGDLHALSPDLAAVLRIAQEVHVASGGAFDPTVMALVEVWGFGPGGAPLVGEEPSESALAAAQGRVGLARLGLEFSAGGGATLRKQVEGLRLDLNAIAPGYAADVIAAAFEELGVEEYMIEVGGEVLARGLNTSGQVWRIGIEVPDGGTRELYASVPLANAGLATSGDYRKYREVGGKRISHTIDPRSGRPISHELASVTVIQPTCAAADAWATALNVLGPEEGFALAEAKGIPALFIIRDGEGFREKTTSALGTLMPAAPPPHP